MKSTCIATFVGGPCDGMTMVLPRYTDTYSMPVSGSTFYFTTVTVPTEKPNLRYHRYEVDSEATVRNDKEILVKFIYKGESL